MYRKVFKPKKIRILFRRIFKNLDEGGTWDMKAPNCCLSVGCSDDFKLDLFLVVDASSSIGEENFKLGTGFKANWTTRLSRSWKIRKVNDRG